MADQAHSVHRLVADGLVAAGLHGDLFDAEAIATDLADRLVVDAGLDEFVGQGDPGAPVPFDAEDPR
jgi:hypothetical protein